MRRFLNLIKFLFVALLVFKAQIVCADVAPISLSDAEDILNPVQKSIYQEQKQQKTLYAPKNEEAKLNNTFLKKENNIIKINDIKDDIKDETNIIIKDSLDRILSESSRKINAIYPNDNISPTNTYPGYRGPNQLVIYTRDFARTTGTNEFGKEAIVEDGIVVALTGANSNIPRDGFVVSGHGNAKKWISDNLKIGTKVEINNRTIRAYTTIESYRYFAKMKIKSVENVLISTKSDYDNRDDKFIYYYLKKAKQMLKKSKRNSSDVSLTHAKEAINYASLAFRYTLPYIENELKGTWIRPNSKNIYDIQKTLDKIKETGINNVFLETYFHGRTIFPSKTMEEYGFEEQNPDFVGADVLSIWIKEAHKRGIKIHVWFESFYVGNKNPQNNPKSILSVKPEWMNRTKQKADFEGYVSHPQEHNGYFLDPANPEVIEFLLKLISEITVKYNVDGVNIDYVRYPNISKENLNNQWGYTKYAREEFFLIYATDPIEIQPRSAFWDDWCEYRRNKITRYIYEVHNLLKHKDIMFSAVIFPDYKVSLQTKFQDWYTWVDNCYLKAITPLILTGDDNLAKSMLEEIKRKTSNNAKIFPGLFAGFIESDPEDLLRQIHIVRKLKLDGVILFDWAHLNDNYRDVLKTSVFKEQTY
ncbi:MAG: family 10 glycosylhydrolase [Candidatus Gastranaerophilales bacterium]|nr:family 10 glycosylhydrolase [Candidatus Gastranaerophilales bacterium]